ncbi:hypothetical protein D3C81_1747640 [compost metagenome]
MCLANGFDFLFQVRTPLPGCPNSTQAMCGIFDEPTPTMQGCLDLIKQREVIAVEKDRGFRSADLRQSEASDNKDSQKASE